MAISNVMKKVAAVVGLSALGLMGSDNAEAASFQNGIGDTSTFEVTATVTANCTVAAGGVLSFGAFQYGVDNDGATSVDVDCSTGVPFEVHFDSGLNGNRTMTGSVAGFLSYQLYQDAGRTTALSFVTGTGTGVGVTQAIDVFGRIPSGQTPADGDYSDTIGVQVWY